ncbi:MAG TPA: hypothetical protein VFU22_08715, partial [Roseiflexaceae bacterium]|nr:hypothetical protein [Roseiflexaceae bacterium]
IWLATGYERAPFPDLTSPLEHPWDFAIAPVFALVGLSMPTDALPHFLAFQGPRQVEQVLGGEPQRVATAWLGAKVMIGAEDSRGSKPVNEQFHPATIHWLIDDERVGWIRLRHPVPVDARAEDSRLSIICAGALGAGQELVFQISAPGADPAALQHGAWRLPGLAVQVETNAGRAVAARSGDLLEVRYSASDDASREPIQFVLQIEPGEGDRE